MPDGNGLNFDTNLPSDQSSVKEGAAQIRALRTALRNWSGNNGEVAGSIFSANTAVATLTDNAIASSKLQAPENTVAPINAAPDIGANYNTYSAVAFNAKGQAVKAKKATLDELASMGSSKLAATNLAPSATATQFLRTNSTGTAVEWVSSSQVSKWETSQALSFTQGSYDTYLDINYNLYSAAWDGTRFAICGSRQNVRQSRELLAYANGGVTDNATTSIYDIGFRTDSAAVNSSATVQIVTIGYESGNATNPCVVYTATGTAANGIAGGTKRATSGSVMATARLNAVEYGGGSWVFAGNTGALYQITTGNIGTSGALGGTNGVNINSVSAGTQNLYDLKPNGSGLFVVVGAAGTILTYSPGGNATVRTSGTAADLRGVAYGNGRFVVVGNNGIVLTSTDDGVNWTSKNIGTTTFNSVDYGNGRFVIAGAGGKLLSSPDGTTWTDVSSRIYTLGDTVGTVAADLNRVVFCQNTWVVVGNAGTVLFSGDLPVVGWNVSIGVADKSWTTPVTYRVPNPLGAVPELVKVYLVCVTDQLGYVAGDVIPFTTWVHNVASPSSGVVTHGAIQVPDLTVVAATMTGINPSFWRVRLTAACLS
jgi:hypothetical protein